MRQKRSFSVEQAGVNDLAVTYGSIPLKTVIRKYSETGLLLALQSIFTHNNDSVLDLVNQSKNIGDQYKVLETMRLVRLQRQTMLSQFLTVFGDAYARQFLSQHATGSSIEDYIYHDEIFSNLQLNNEVLEIRAAVDKTADNIKRRQWEVQSSLTQRFSKLAGHSYNVNNYPISAWTVCESFAKVVSGLQTSLSKKLIIMKMFDHTVGPKLEQLYISINDILIADGISQLDSGSRWGSDTEAPGGLTDLPVAVISNSVNTRLLNSTLISSDLIQSDVAKIEATGCQSGVTRSELDYNMQRFVSMQEMLHPETADSLTDSSAQCDAKPCLVQKFYRHEDVVAGLSLLQEKILLIDHKEVILHNRNVRPNLFNTLQVITNEDAAVNLDRKSADVIDIVSKMFDFILDDASLPLTLRSIMIRLQIPIIKVAILDDEFFNSRLQCARRLLNEFAYSANVLYMLNQNGDEKEKSTYDQLKRIVDVVLKDFSMDISVFSAQLKIIQQVVREVIKDRKIKTKKIQIAKSLVVGEIERKLSNQVVPQVVDVFIKNIWNQVLTKVAIRTNGKGAIWAELLCVTDDLIWSTQPKLMEQERNMLVRMIPRLLNRLQDGLCLIKYNQNLIDQFFKHMEEVHLHSLRGLSLHPARLPSSETYLVSGDNRSIDLRGAHNTTKNPSVTYYEGEAVTRQNLQDNCYASTSPLPKKMTPSLCIVSEMELGTWVEFSSNQRSVMGKLEWRCDFTGEFRFVDRNNTIVHSTNLDKLVLLFEQSKAKLNDDIPLFDRAVDAVYVRLQVA
ncbi:MAG: DUF1631 family protein [Thiohalomonadales bacterium]